ncbi:MAG TPA: O-antigen ligase family protein [Bryobacteraceae bacterium]|nr:O-antigen ligase family protein [Bryobacteraceae bacterium]
MRASIAEQDVDVWGRRFVIIAIAGWAVGVVTSFTTALSLLTSIGFIAALAGWSKPVPGLYGVAMLATLDALTRVYLLTGGLLRWNSFNYLMAATLLVFAGKTMRLTDIHTRILLAFMFLLGLQLAITDDRYSGLHTLLNLIAPCGILLYFARVNYNRQCIIWIAWINGTVAALGGLVYLLQIFDLPTMNKNAWSAFPLTALISICLAYVISPPKQQFRLGLLALVSVAWVFLSGSRGGMLVGLVCVVFLLAMTQQVRHRLSLFAVAPAIVTVILGLFSALSDTSLQRVTMLFDSERELESRTSGRSDLYVAGWRMFQDNPLGVGTGGFGRALSRRTDDDLVISGTELGAHSAWVQALVENGIFGFLVIAAYVLSFAVAGFRSGVPGYFSLGLMVTLVLGGAFFSRSFHSKGLWLASAGYVALTMYGLPLYTSVWRRKAVPLAQPLRYPVAAP